MQIFIKFTLERTQCLHETKFPSNCAKTLTLDVEPENTLNEVKELIQLESGILPIEQRLWFGHDLHDDEATLKDLKVKKESTLILDHSNRYPSTVTTQSMLVAKAVREGKTLGFIKQLLDAKADPNSRYRDTQCPDIPETALHYASWCRDDDSVQIISLLLERKADIHALADPFGTPLHFASHYANTEETVRFLLQKGANSWISYRGTQSATNIKWDISLPKEAKSCSICLEKLSRETAQAILPCQHFFHAVCLKKAVVVTSGTCPLCRRKMIQDTVAC